MKINVKAGLWLVSLLTCLGLGQVARAADEDLQREIVRLTQQIEKTPGNPELFLKRAQLQRLERNYDEALSDLEQAAGGSNQCQLLHLARAEVLRDAGWFKSAKAAADRFLSLQPNHFEALVLRARLRAKLSDRLGAVQDYSRAVANSPQPAPEIYMERADALAAEGGEHLSEALRGLEQGMAKLGPLVTLQLAAIEVELKQNRIDAALTRIDQAMALVPRKESWLARRAEILQQAGRAQAAAENFKAALAALDTLPPARRNAPAMAELEQRIRAGLAAVQK